MTAGADQSVAIDFLAADVETPALVVDLESVRSNLAEMQAIAAAAGVRLAPHGKTHRMAQFASLQFEYGASSLCVAKLGEAEAFADAGVESILVAYPIVGASKARRALALHRRLDLRLGANSVEGIHDLSECFAEAGQTAKVMIAVDTGLGREGVSPKGAVQLADAIGELPGVRLEGIYTHEGNTYEAIDRADLERRAQDSAHVMVDTARRIREAGHEVSTVSMGASASARLVAGVEGVTEIRPGIYAFNDVGQLALGNTTLEGCAIRVVATVISNDGSGRALVDAGSKALGADLVPASAHRDAYPGFGLVANAPEWQIDRVSEEHGWLRWAGQGVPSELPVGSRVAIVPNHACMAFAMLRRAVVVGDGQSVHWDGFGPGTSE